MTTLLDRDERETAVDHAADRLSFVVLAYGLLAIAAWRGFSGESTWDLLGLVILGGLAGFAYRLRAGVVTRSWTALALGAVGVALVVAVLLALGVGR